MTLPANPLNLDHSSTSIAAYDAESERPYSYRQLGADVRRIAGLLESSSKALVFCFSRNDYHMLCGYLGVVAAGHAVMLLDPDSTGQSSLIGLYRPEYILRSPRSPSLSYEGYTLADSLGPLLWRRGIDSAEHPIHPELTLLLTTSGSTGTPKFVRLSSTNLFANAISITHDLQILDCDCAITSLPFHYSYGLSVVNSHLLAGGKLVFTPEVLTSRSFWSVCRDHNCTSFAGVPYSYHLLGRLGFPNDELPAIKTMTQAGGHLSSAMVSHYSQLMAARKGRFFVMYGQTEATARISILPPEYLPEKLGSVGKVISGGEIKVVPGGARGTIQYIGPNVMLGYAHCRADLSRGDELNGRLNTGDAGHLDPDGFLFVTGRMDRYAKVSGVRINLDEVESLLRPCGPSAVVGSGDRLIIFCEASQNDLFRTQRDALAKTLSLHHRFVDLRPVDSLPLKANGKIDYRVLEEVAAQC